MRKQLRLPFFLLGATLCGSALHATTFTFPFTNPGNPLGTSQAYVITVGASSATITASALITAATGFSGTILFAKSDGANETGLGLTNDPTGDHEIVNADAIVLDFSAIANVQSISIEMGSVQSPDTWSLYGSNTTPTARVSLVGEASQTAILVNQSSDQLATNTPLLIYNTSADHTLYSFYTVTEGDTNANSNVVLGEIVVTTGTATPEPASFGFMGIACAGLFLARRKLSSR
jgi:hypothetical protein